MKKLPSLDGLRGASILLVINSHLVFNEHINIYHSDFKILNAIIRRFYDGQLGVNIFFVVSGFLITRILLHESHTNGNISLRNFYVRRTLRIFPAYYFLLFVYFILQLTGFHCIEPESWLSAVTYTKYFNHDVDWVTGHAWTLSVEEQFYLLWPLAISGGERMAKKIALGIVLVVPIIRIVDYEYSISFIDQYTLFYRIDAIAIGCLTAFYEQRIIQALNRYWSYIFPIALMGIFSSNMGKGILIKYDLIYLHIGFGSSFGSVANLCIAIIILYSIYGPEKLWYRILNSGILVRIGTYSYSLYLWQQFFLSHEKNWITQFPQNILLTMACAVLSYHLIEMPFLKLKSRFSH